VSLLTLLSLCFDSLDEHSFREEESPELNIALEEKLAECALYHEEPQSMLLVKVHEQIALEKRDES
jgi:hypothetical protein